MIGVDTGFFIQLMRGDTEAAEIWKGFAATPAEPVVSVLTLGEILYLSAKVGKPDTGKDMVRGIMAVARIIDIDATIIEKAASLRHEEGMPYIDALVTASFVENRCTTIPANDRHRFSGKERNVQDNLLDFEKLILNITSGFFNPDANQVDAKIVQALKNITEFLDVDGGSFLIFEPGDIFHRTHTWSRPGLSNTFFTNERTSMRQYPWFLKKLIKGDLLTIANIDAIPADAVNETIFFQAAGYNTFIMIPFTGNEGVLGALAFYSYSQARELPGEMLLRLKVIGHVFSNVLIRKRKEFDLENALERINNLKNQIEAERNYLREEIKLEHNFDEIIGRSRPLMKALNDVEQVARMHTTVMLLGETGTGKELFARAIHNLSDRKDRPLIKVNCSAFSKGLIESELFGHVKGAFTGAVQNQVGRFELADGGTLFLDEIGEMPLELQPKMLRAIQEGEFERLGSSRTIQADVRIIAATNRNLEEEVKKGRFRKDLWYRLHVFPVHIPPLRERNEDIQTLARHFVKKYATKTGKDIRKISRKMIVSLNKYHWPGNVRELENVIERSIIVSRSPVLELPDDLDPALNDVKWPHQSLDKVQRDHIVNVLNDTHWKIEGQSGAAQILQINPATLRSRMKKLNIVKGEMPY